MKKTGYEKTGYELVVITGLEKIIGWLPHLFLGWKSPNSTDKSGIGAVNAFKIYYT